MKILISKHPLPLVLLLLQLLQPLQFQDNERRYDLPPDKADEFEDYLEEFSSTGPTRPPTKKKFIRLSLIGTERTLSDSFFCTDTVRLKNVHNKSRCVTEHNFIVMPYDDVKNLCYTRYVECKNGIKKCHRSRLPIEGVYCKLRRGTTLPDCDYDSTYKMGFVLITCRWQNSIKKLVPVHVNDILVLQD
ncbi:inactive ribonuclease-like protein 9 [Oryctolagus cuniculus]|nr:inactive ribonuclease-like protein 9 [Oryctolagus cuniculus]CDG32072.1 TPA: ribonuclease A K1 [Oryctolagus cuniculus]